MQKQYCVISHTHWDREWYQSFEEYRYRFVKLMDNLLQIFKEYPDYVFFLDAQTLIVEDYLQIRPHRREEVLGTIASGNLLVGPWYVQGDFHLTSGEAIIRNLLIGSRMAAQFGGCQSTGYTPDQFGICSQVPQIFKGFDLKACVFGRGYKEYQDVDGDLALVHSPTEFLWESPDGSSILAVSMHHWYNNAQRFSADPVKARKLLQRIEEATNDIALTPYILLMNGVDHLEAQEDLLPILDTLNDGLPDDQFIAQVSMDAYIDKVAAYLESTPNPRFVTQHGEMRHGAQHILMNTLSSRVYLKQANFRDQYLLESTLEPLYAFIAAMGAGDLYPADHFRYMWRLLMENHPHDSICGCSVDDVHSEMETRFRKVENLGSSLLEDGLTFFTDHLDRTGMDEDDYLLAIFNTTEVARQAVIEVELTFPCIEGVSNFELIDADGQSVPYMVLEKTQRVKRTLSPINLPGTLDVDSYTIQLMSNRIAPLGYEAYKVRACAGAVDQAPPVASPIMENDSLSVRVHDNGQIDLTVKATGHTYTDLLKLVDREDIGESYLYRKSETGATYLSSQFPTQVKMLPGTPFRQQCQLDFTMELPESYDYAKNHRANRTKSVPVTLTLTLDQHNPGLQVAIALDNTVMVHRLRALFNTGYSTDTVYASQPFDVVTRSPHPLAGTHRNADEPNSGLICVQGQDDGLAVFNKGLYEYEYPAGGTGQLALTLVRANNRFSGDSPFVVAPEALTPGNQVLRPLSYELMVLPYQGDNVSAQVVAEAKSFHNPLLTCFQPVNRHKFTGGRPAVQDTDIRELFFRPMPHAEIMLPLRKQFFEIVGENIELSALKQGEDDTMLVLRVWNSGEKDSTFGIHIHQAFSRAVQLNLNEQIIANLPVTRSGITDIPIKAKEIITLGVWL